MSQPDFEGIVQNICKDIKGKRCRSEAQEELLGHLEDTYERNIATGKSEDEAYDLAVKALGNTRLLSQQLAAVHDNSPASQMKSALWLFIFGFILVKFHIEFFAGMKQICIFIGIVITLLSLYLMRTVSRKMKLAFIFYASYFAILSVNNCVTGYGVKNEIFNYSYIVLSSVCLALMWIFVILGFMEMNSAYCSDSEKRKPFLGFVLIYAPLETAVSCGLIIMNEGENIDGEAGMLFLVLAAVYIFILIQFIKLKNRLWDADARYGIDSFNKKNIPAVFTAIGLCIVCPMFFMYAYAVKDTPKTELVIHDAGSETEADEVREQMLALGMNEDVLALLPDSEVLNYKDADFMETVAGYGYTNRRTEWNAYDFFFYDEKSDELKMRSLYVFHIYDSRYRAGFYLKNADSLLHLVPDEEAEIYVSVVCKQGNKYYKKEPINCDFSSMYSPEACKNGFDFRAEENQTVMFAFSADVINFRENFNIGQGVVYVTQRIPFALSYKTVEDMACAAGNSTMFRYVAAGNSTMFSDVSDIAIENYVFYDRTIIYSTFMEMFGADSEL